LGILWVGWIGSILAVIFGFVSLKQIKARNESGRGMAIAGVALGWTGVGIGIIAATLVLVGAVNPETSGRIPTPEHLVAGPRITLPPALFLANPPGSSTLVTSFQADQVAKRMWGLWENAQIQRNTTALTQLVAPGVVRRSELLEYAWPTGGCVPEKRPRPVFSIESVVPLQRTYPIYFLSQVLTNEYIGNFGSNNISSWVELQVLTKSGPSKPWQLSFDAGYDGVHSPPPEMSFDEQESASQVPGSAPLFINPAPSLVGPVATNRYLPLLAAYWQSWKDIGAAPPRTVFRNDGDTSGFGEQIAAAPQGNTLGAGRQDYAYSADLEAGSWVFSAFGGYPMVCGTIQVTDTSTPLGGLPAFVQNSDRTNWGMALPPDVYSRIVTTNTHQSCVYAIGSQLDAAGGTTDNIINVRGTPSL
jgi:hypothetical protein